MLRVLDLSDDDTPLVLTPRRASSSEAPPLGPTVPPAALPRQDGSVDRPDERMEPEPGSERAPDGVDPTLIRWMLSLTPEERLRVLQERQDALEALGAVPRWTSEPS